MLCWLFTGESIDPWTHDDVFARADEMQNFGRTAPREYGRMPMNFIASRGKKDWIASLRSQ